MRYLAIDYGVKRTGLAVGDDLTGQAGPVGMIEADSPGKLLRGLRDAIDEYDPDELVVGIPLNMDGTIGEPAKKIEALCQLLEQHTHLTVHRVDERLTTYEADELMKASGLTRGQKKDRRDALAAAAILRDFLARH
jgi:putative Holliday junction resolvase